MFGGFPVDKPCFLAFAVQDSFAKRQRYITMGLRRVMWSTDAFTPPAPVLGPESSNRGVKRPAEDPSVNVPKKHASTGGNDRPGWALPVSPSQFSHAGYLLCLVHNLHMQGIYCVLFTIFTCRVPSMSRSQSSHAECLLIVVRLVLLVRVPVTSAIKQVPLRW